MTDTANTRGGEVATGPAAGRATSLASLRVSRLALALSFAGAVLAALLAMAIGNRAEWLGSDTAVYMSVYRQKLLGGEPEVRFELLYEGVSDAFAALNLAPMFFFTFLSLVGFVVIAASARQLAKYFGGRFSGACYLLVLLPCLAASPIFLAAQTNVIRQGLAALLLILFGILLLRRASVPSLAAIGGLAVGFHYTSIIYLASIAVTRLPRVLVYVIVVVSAALYLANLSETLVALASAYLPFDVYRAIREYGAGFEYRRGVRLDFAIFTLAVGLAATSAGALTMAGMYRERFLSLTTIYWALVLPFFVFGFGAFSDRFLLAGWLFASWLAALPVYALLVYWRVSGPVLIVPAILSVLGLVLYLARLSASAPGA